jgi:hypothetical protein
MPEQNSIKTLIYYLKVGFLIKNFGINGYRLSVNFPLVILERQAEIELSKSKISRKNKENYTSRSLN